MSLRGEVDALVHRGPRCTVQALLDGLDGSSRAELLDCLADPEVQGAALARALTARGHRIGPFPIQRHRRRECRCP